MKLTVLLVTFCLFTLAYTNTNDPTQIEKYGEKVKTYQLDVPGKEPITIIETAPITDQSSWEEISRDSNNKDDIEIKNLMTHIIHDVNENNPRCYGPSCQEGFNSEDGPQKEFDDYILDNERSKDYRDYSKDRIDAITALAAKLKKDKLKADRYSSISNEDSEEDDGNGKVYSTWNRLKVKQHKHPFDDKDGWVTLEPVAWSTSKISKWKPNIKKHKPIWNEDNDRFPSQNDDPYNNYQGMGNGYSYNVNKPSMSRPQFINNKLHVQTADFDSEIPSKPAWMKPQQSSFASTWSPDDSRRPHKPNCDSHADSYTGEDAVYYGISDSLVTDHRPSNFPHDYEALHKPALQRPIRRPTQVVYAGAQDYDSDRSSRPPYGDGQWVLLSTTKGYKNKKRQRSLTPNPPVDDRLDYSTVTSHQAVALTVLPVDNDHTNMTTSHGGLLEVEKSFQTVEESKRDMDKVQDLGVSASHNRPAVFKRVVKRKMVSNLMPDSSTVLAAVGAGMVPATMAMVVPMMLGRRRRRDLQQTIPETLFNPYVNYRYQ